MIKLKDLTIGQHVYWYYDGLYSGVDDTTVEDSIYVHRYDGDGEFTDLSGSDWPRVVPEIWSDGTPYITRFRSLDLAKIDEYKHHLSYYRKLIEELRGALKDPVMFRGDVEGFKLCEKNLRDSRVKLKAHQDKHRHLEEKYPEYFI